MILVLTAVPDAATGERIARALLKRKLAACVTVGRAFASFYRWKGKLEKSREALLLIKTGNGHFERVKKALLETHPYELPEIIAVPVKKGSNPYLRWIESSLAQ